MTFKELMEGLVKAVKEAPYSKSPAALHKQTGLPRRRYAFDPDPSPPDTICLCGRRRDEHCDCGSVPMTSGRECDGFVRRVDA